MENNNEIPLKEKIDTIFNQLGNEQGKIGKIKQLKIPRKAKTRRGRRKKGWVGVITFHENGNVSGERAKIEGGVFNLKGGTYHATDGKEIRYWNGKFPVLFQPTWRINPINFSKDVADINQTYGLKYIQAKMLKDTIKAKGKGMGGLLIWIAVAVAGFFLAKYIFKF